MVSAQHPMLSQLEALQYVKSGPYNSFTEIVNGYYAKLSIILCWLLKCNRRKPYQSPIIIQCVIL